MSLHTFKKKSIIKHGGTKRSGKPPGGNWLTQGPFGSKAFNYTLSAPGGEGFSLNGGRRNTGYVGQSMRMSKNGTPFRGVHAKGNGGCCGTYVTSNQVYNLPLVKAEVLGGQAGYIKPSVLSSKGMITKKYRWIHNGQYPNYWVQPVYPNGNLSDNASQQVYIDQKAAATITVNHTNKPEIYADKKGPPCNTFNNCRPSRNIAYNTYNNVASNAPFTKQVGIPQTSAQYTLQVQRKCAQPCDGKMKPFPFATSSGSKGSKSDYAPVGILTPVYNSPPVWYNAYP